MGLGSNLGNRLGWLRNGLEHLESGGVFPKSVSRLYESAPLYVTDQPPFLNAVAKIATDCDRTGLLELITEVEDELGRVRSERFGPRTLDLDILMWGEDGQGVVRMPKLIIPHPRILERAFVLMPLADVAGERVHPSINLSFSELAATIDSDGVEVVAGADWYQAH